MRQHSSMMLLCQSIKKRRAQRLLLWLVVVMIDPIITFTSAFSSSRNIGAIRRRTAAATTMTEFSMVKYSNSQYDPEKAKADEKDNKKNNEKKSKNKMNLQLPYYFRQEALSLKPKLQNRPISASSNKVMQLLMEDADVGQDILEEVTLDVTSIVEPPVMFAGEEENYEILKSTKKTGNTTMDEDRSEIEYVSSHNINTFDFERWELHRSPDRYFRLLIGVFGGITFRRIFPTVLILIIWSTGVDYYNSIEDMYGLPAIELPITPFELAAPVLGLLLVFRSNTAFERFNVGSDATWEITCRFRCVIRQLLSFTAGPERGYTQDERTAAYELVEACFVLHGWILCDYLRQSASTTTTNNGNTNRSQKKQTKILQKSLALPIELTQQLWNDDNTSSADSVSSSASSTSSPIPSSLRFLLRNQQRYQYQSPSALINIITLGMMTRIPSLDPQEATLIEEQFTEIISSVGTCEKILRTPIPLGYTRYAVRFTMIWLTLLPLALVRTFAEFGTESIDTSWWVRGFQPELVIAILFLSVVFLSIEDISVQIEEPLCVLPLDLHQKWLKRDIVQMKRTSQLVDEIVSYNHKNHKGASVEKKKNTNTAAANVTNNADNNKQPPITERRGPSFVRSIESLVSLTESD